MNHYVYYSYEEWGRGYIGVRSCKCLPEEDRSYFGSFYDKTFTPAEKIILGKFETREQALQAEIDLHSFYQVHKNSHFANKAKQTSEKFAYSPLGKKASEEAKLKMRLAKLGKKLPPKTIAKMLESRKGYRPSEETRQKIREANTGDIWSEERKQNKRLERLGTTHTVEAREKLRSIFSEKWQCTVTGHVTNNSALTRWQKRHGIDITNRVRLSEV